MTALKIILATKLNNQKKGQKMKITKEKLRGIITHLNYVTGSLDEPYTKTKDENGRIKLTPNVGCYYLSGGYGGYQVQRMSNGGGCSCPLGEGYYPKAELVRMIRAYINGYIDCRSCSTECIS